MTKILKASSCYLYYIKWFYARNPGLAEKSYADQLGAIHWDSNAQGDTWKRYLEPSGNFQVEEVIVNVEPLQKAWAKEHSLKYNHATWMKDIFLAQVAEASPDVLFAHAREVSERLISEVRSAVGKKRIFTIGFEGIAKHDIGVVLEVDLVLSCLERTVDFYKGIGKKAYYLPHGFDPAILERCRASSAEAVDLSFIGQVSPVGGHRQRMKWLSEINRSFPVSSWLGDLPSPIMSLRRQIGASRRGDFSGLAAFPKALLDMQGLRKSNKGTLFGLPMYAQLAASKISLNIHIGAAGKEAANMRLFEVTGMGSCLLTDWKQNLSDFFELEKEVVTFRSIEEALEKIRWLLTDEAARRSIGKAGQARTLRSHNSSVIFRELGDCIFSHI